MRKTFLLAMILLVSAAWAVAQQDPTAPSAQAPGAQNPRGTAPNTQDMPATPSQTIEGCLGGAAGNFTVTDKSGTTYPLELPPGTDTDKLSKHVGAEVSVTGNMASAASGAAGNGSSIQVTRMNKIADTCSNSSTANPSK